MVKQLTETASNALMYIVVILLGTSVGATTSAEAFLNMDTIKIVVLGLIAFIFGTAGGVLLGKLMCKLSGGKINPLIGSAGVIRRAYGCQSFSEGRRGSGSHQLPSDARHGTQCGRRNRYGCRGRYVYGHIWCSIKII